MMEFHPEYIWKAEYQDGFSLLQYDTEGREHLFKEIDQDRLKVFSWVPRYGHGPIYSIKLQSYQRLIAFRRVAYTPSTGERKTIYALGWQATINGKNYKSINFIHPGQSVVTAIDI